MEIANCRWCGGDAFVDRAIDSVYVRTRCKHWVSGPSCKNREDAIRMWNEMMYTGVQVKTDSTSTDYRDRVDRMVVAIITGCYANPTLGNISDDKIANWAISQIDAIDTMLKEREALGEVKK